MKTLLQNEPQALSPSANTPSEGKGGLFLIQPSCNPSGIHPTPFDAYLHFIDGVVRQILPQELLSSLLAAQKPAALKEQIQAFNDLLPLISWNELHQAPSTLCMTFLCPADFTSGVGRYLGDTLSRWLIPGKFLNITSSQSLNFKFAAFPEAAFFIQQILLDISDEKELLIVRNNIDDLAKEIRLNIMAVKHARHVVTIKKLSLEQKKIIIQENIASVLERPSKNLEQSAFDQMHHFLVHLSAEEKLSQIKDQFAPFMEQRPKVFDRDIFDEIKHSVLLFQNPFTSMRDLRHVGRIISYQYLFRKSLQHAMMTSPQERHLSIKLMKTSLRDPYSKMGKRSVLSVLGGINVLRENELFEEKHITEAIQRCLPQVKKVENSFIIDRRSHDPIRTFYIEIEKEEGDHFTLRELKEFQRQLPLELKESIENVVHPVFMPRNEEEIMRNIVILSQQLKYIHDIPQVIITFDQQTEEELSFTVILLRLVKPSTVSIPEHFHRTKTDLKLHSHEVKYVGTLRKRYLKEANVFSLKVEKRPFLRKDYTLDLFKARQAISAELHRILGGIRDFNGGILSKQQEVFHQLRDSIADTHSYQDFLLENFFYSLSPPLRQTLLPPAILKKLFNMLQEALQVDYRKDVFSLKAYMDDQFLLLLIASPHVGIKEELIVTVTSLEIPTAVLSCTEVHAYGTHCVGYIYQDSDHHRRTVFYESIYDALHRWQHRFKK